MNNSIARSSLQRLAAACLRCNICEPLRSEGIARPNRGRAYPADHFDAFRLDCLSLWLLARSLVAHGGKDNSSASPASARHISPGALLFSRGFSDAGGVLCSSRGNALRSLASLRPAARSRGPPTSCARRADRGVPCGRRVDTTAASGLRSPRGQGSSGCRRALADPMTWRNALLTHRLFANQCLLKQVPAWPFRLPPGTRVGCAASRIPVGAR